MQGRDALLMKTSSFVVIIVYSLCLGAFLFGSASFFVW